LSANGVAPADIDAHEVGKGTTFEQESNPPPSPAHRAALLRYEVSRSFSVVMRKVAAWSAIGTKLLQMQNVEEVEARFDRSDRLELQSQLITEAAHDAQKRAEVLAAGFGQRLGAVQAISQDPLEGISYRLLRGAGESYASGRSFSSTTQRMTANQFLVPSTISFVESVNAIYRLDSSRQ
jgi:uncharacterized protein